MKELQCTNGGGDIVYRGANSDTDKRHDTILRQDKIFSA